MRKLSNCKLNYLPGTPRLTLISAKGVAAMLGRPSWPFDTGSRSYEGAAVEPTVLGTAIHPVVSVLVPSVVDKA